MPRFLIDDKGKRWEARSLALRVHLRASLGDRELAQFAVLNLGFIAVAVHGWSVHIKLRPARVAPAALGSLYLWLHERGVERVVVSWYEGRWRDEIIGWGMQGWRRLTALLETTRLPTRVYSREQTSLDRLGRENPLRHVLQDGSRLTRYVFNPQMLPATLRSRYVLLTEDADGELRVADFGDRMMSRSCSWRRQARGHRVDDMPDWSYGRWVADAYYEARQRGQPLLEEVNAIIDWPEVGTYSHSYWRLIVPLIEPARPARLLGVTVDNARVGVYRVG